MTYFGLWKLNKSLQPPPTPEGQIMQQEGFNMMIRAQLQAGRLRDVHAYLEGDAGYFFYEGSNEQLAEDLALWSPYVNFEVHETLPIQKSTELALSAYKKRAGKA